MTEPLTISQLGNPILRQIARPVEQVKDADIQTLIDHLLTTLTASNGVGIAAPQVGVDYQIVIVASRPNPRYPHAPLMEPTVMINPQLISHGEEVVKDWEGCLSVPGIRGQVPRYRQIHITYINRDGERVQQQLHDFVARIFQHEFDHLSGLVFLDRIESTQDLITEQEYMQRVVPAQATTGSVMNMDTSQSVIDLPE